MSDAFDASPPELATGRARLRAFSVADAPAFHAYAFDPEVARFMPWRPRSSELFAKGYLGVITRPQFLNWAITLPPADQAIGMVFLHAFSREHRRAEIAFNLGQAHWGRGLATEVARAVLGFGFQRLGLNRIEALCMPENVASRKVLLKLGMSFEGTMRQAHHRHDGFQDMDLFALLASEFAASDPGRPPAIRPLSG
jgi:[ribosomal protein S5]-alanine N-acetyltransferase